LLEVVDVLLLLLAAGLLLAVLLRPQSSAPEARLKAALAEIRRQEGHFPNLRGVLGQVRVYGRDLAKLLPLTAEAERFLAKPSLEAPTRARLEARRDELRRAFERGAGFLERLGVEMLLEDGHEPPALRDFPLFLIELREVLHPHLTS